MLVPHENAFYALAVIQLEQILAGPVGRDLTLDRFAGAKQTILPELFAQFRGNVIQFVERPHAFLQPAEKLPAAIRGLAERNAVFRLVRSVAREAVRAFRGRITNDLGA